ncbi:MAG: hypothetical protein DMG71_18535, partial [Acidobacteria bacterium]
AIATTANRRKLFFIAFELSITEYWEPVQTNTRMTTAAKAAYLLGKPCARPVRPILQSGPQQYVVLD